MEAIAFDRRFQNVVHVNSLGTIGGVKLEKQQAYIKPSRLTRRSPQCQPGHTEGSSALSLHCDQPAGT
jgi:hypothetical protein